MLAGVGGPGIQEAFAGASGCRLEPGLSWSLCVWRDAGSRSRAPPGTGNFPVLDPLFPRLAGRTDSPGCPDGACGDLAFLGLSVGSLGVGRRVKPYLRKKEKVLRAPGTTIFRAG